MAGRIVVDVLTLAAKAQELKGLSGQLDAQAYQLRQALGFLISRPDIPNQASLMASYTSATQSLDAAALMSGQMSTAIVRYERRIVDCENGMLRSGDGPTARPWGGPRSLLPTLGGVPGFGVNAFTKIWGVADSIVALAAPWAREAILLRTLNKGSVATLAALNGISKSSAKAIVAAREGGAFKSSEDLLIALKRAGLDKNQRLAAKTALGEAADARRLQLARRLEGMGSVGKAVGSGRLGAKLAPYSKGLKVVGKGVAVVDLYGSVVTAQDQWTDNAYDNKNMLGGDRVEDTMAGVGLVTSVAGTAAAFGLVANPVGLAVIGGAALAVGAYYAAPYVWKGGKWVAGQVGDGVGYVGDKVSDGYHHAKDAVSHKLGSAKKKIADKLPGWMH